MLSPELQPSALSAGHHQHNSRSTEDLLESNIGLDSLARDGSKCHGRSDSSVTRSKPEGIEVATEDEANSLIAEETALSTMAPEMDLPRKKYSSIIRNLRWTILSVYRRLFIVIILANFICIVTLAAQRNILSLSPDSAALAVSANLTLAVLIRQELVINLLFWLFGKCPTSFPLRIRRLSAKIYHLGGVHSGSGISAFIWFIIFNITIIRRFQNNPSSSRLREIIIITSMLDVLLTAIVATAHPTIRAKIHNAFEMVHRFAGWTAVLLFWFLLGLTIDAGLRDSNSTNTFLRAGVSSPNFWLLLVTTISIISPWMWLRKVPVTAEPLSKHAIRLHFSHRNLPLCAAARLSDNPLLEWHAFAGIPEENGQGFSLLVSKSGDWTNRIINSPPTSIWVRGLPAMGVLHIAPIFKKSVLVATGSGIGPVMSLICHKEVSCRILWSTPNPEATYSKNIIQAVRRADSDAVIINTTTSGRPDLIKLTYQLYKSSGAEAVFVISNKSVTRKVVYALESRGVPIFAPIFDS